MTESFNAKPGWRALVRAARVGLRVSLTATPGWVIAVSVMRIVTEFAAPLQAWGLKLLTDSLFRSDRDGGLRAAALIASMQVMSDALNWLYISVLMGLRERVGHAMDRELIHLAMDVPGIEHYERPDYQDQLQLLRQDRAHLADIPDSAIGMLGLVVRIGTVLGLLAAIHPLLVLLPLFGIPSIAFGGQAERRRLRLQERVIERIRSVLWMYETATERDLGKELRVFRMRKPLLARHDAMSREVAGEMIANEALTQAYLGLGWFIFASGFVAAVALVLNDARHGRATPGDVVLTLTLAQQINNQLTGAVGNVQFWVRSARVGHRFVWLSDYATTATAAVVPVNPVAPPNALRDGIVFEDVSFTYPGTETEVLRNVSITLSAGMTVAIVGDNGAGKSTLIKLLCRFYEPTAGQILVDGLPLSAVDPVEWRDRMAAGFQDFARFELLAQTAVGIGDLPCVDDARAVTGALERAGALDVLGDLPQGLETQLGRTFADGVDLSSGQWQKVALGRAMMRDQPLLLLLDEPTSALDPQTEHALFERYAGAARRVSAHAGAITVLVSHRFSTVRMADEIIVVNNGRIEEHGTHEALIARNGLYAELYELQARAYR